jgi:hypothetical protein
MKNIHRAERNRNKPTASPQHKSRARQAPKPEQGRAPITTESGEWLNAHRAASDALIEHSRKVGKVEPLIVAGDMLVGDPWLVEICIGDHLHLEPRKPLPGELIVIEDHWTIRVHRFVSFERRTWTLRSRRGQLLTLPDSAAYWGVVIAVTQIRTIEVNRKTFDPWDALQGRCVGFTGPHPSTCSTTRARN